MAPGPGDASTRVSRGRRLSRREWALLGGAAGAGLVGVLVLLLIGRSHLGADGVLVTVVLGVAVMQALTLAGLLYVVRAVRRDARNTKRFQQKMAVSTDRILRQGKAGHERAATRATRIEKSGQRHHKHVVELGRKLSRQGDEARKEARRLQLVGQRQVQALMNMRDLVRLDAAVPPAGGWAASPDLLLFCVDSMLADEPELVVECGSGLSTLFLALAAEQHELSTRIVALESSETYAAKTRALLERHGVGHRAEVRLAPLERTSLPDHETAWYAESAVDDLDRIGMLIVDGPPALTGPKARYPAVPLLRTRFAQRCTIVVDDLIRTSDEETAEAWSALLPDFEYSVSIDFEKHIGLLTRR
ncbi:MAG: class I SAM-dependent methyltransferase [Marmoricola sp.]